MRNCEVVGCKEAPSKADHPLCLGHWRMDKAGDLSVCANCKRPKDHAKPLCIECFGQKKGSQDSGSASLLKPSNLGTEFGTSAQKVNLALAELGWISRSVSGWSVTAQGLKAGGVNREHSESGKSFVVWPPALLRNRIFTRAIGETVVGHQQVRAEEPEVVAPPPAELGFREKFPAKYQTTDGHVVRSRAELVIDNWLYAAKVFHAYEKRLPIEEEAYCDFWIPEGRVFVEYWGMEHDERYIARKKVKLGLYKANGFDLIELKDKELESLDDHFPRLLLKFGIKTL